MKMMLAVQGVSVLQTRFLLDCKQCLKPAKTNNFRYNSRFFILPSSLDIRKQCVQTTLHMTELFKHTEPLTVAATLNLFLEIDS